VTNNMPVNEQLTTTKTKSKVVEYLWHLQ
jgi:hypothetical protein